MRPVAVHFWHIAAELVGPLDIALLRDGAVGGRRKPPLQPASMSSSPAPRCGSEERRRACDTLLDLEASEWASSLVAANAWRLFNHDWLHPVIVVDPSNCLGWLDRL